MAARRPSNPLALAVLALLAEQPMHPYQMSATLRERRKEDSIKINYGSLYSVVESLRKRGLIEARETVRQGRRPERTIYAITPSGERMLVDWLSELLSTPVKEYPAFEAALALMPVLPPDEVASLLEHRFTQLSLLRKESEALLAKAAAMGLPRMFSIEAEYHLGQLTAELDFVGRLLEDLRSRQLSGIHGWRRLHELRDAGMPQDKAWAIVQDEFKEEFPWLDELDQP